jgi:hypothetical protein
MERLLDRMELPVGGQGLDRRDLAPVGLGGQERARLHGLAVEKHGARPARRRIAADVGSGEADGLPEEVHEEGARLDIRRAHLAVDGDLYLRHTDNLLAHGSEGQAA